MNIIDPVMLRKMARALKLGDNLYTLDDIEAQLATGNMQGHVEGDTWAITQVHDYPNRKAVNILFVVGTLENSLKLEAKVESWSKDIGADLLMAIGRGGWWQFRTPGWRMIGTLYSKDI
jgi:hypothetical protein